MKTKNLKRANGSISSENFSYKNGCKSPTYALIISLLVAAIFWFVMFSEWTKNHVDFWTMMTCAAVVLTSFAFIFGKTWKDIHVTNKEIALGFFSAIILWIVFYIGDKVSGLLFSFARPQVEAVYDMKEGTSLYLISFILLFIIGPAEEIFWRGYIQKNLSMRFNANIGFAITTLIYALVHVWAFNFMLFMAALVVGTIWGLMYRFRPKNLTAIIISHAIWDFMVFILFPI